MLHPTLHTRGTQAFMHRVLALLLLLAAAAQAPAQDSGPVRVNLSLAGGKKVYRAGEPVRLVMAFTSEREGYTLNVTTTKPASAVDTVSLAPEAGAYAWAEQYVGSHGYHPDYASIQSLSQKPSTVELTVNDWYRFDRPGRYTVKVTTSRARGAAADSPEGKALRLTTNEVVFEVVEMSEEEEAAEVRRLSAALDAAKTWQEEARLTEELSYLVGEPSTREKVRRYLSGGRSGNYSQNVYLGLVMARDRALAVRLLEAAIRDASASPTHGLLQAAAGLRLMLEGVPRPPYGYAIAAGGAEHPRALALMREYVSELVESLPKRKGKSRTAAAMTALTSMPREGNAAPSVPQAVRDVLVGEFDSFHPYEQEYLLRVYWDVLRDASLLPAMERMLANSNLPSGYQVKTAALRRMTELSAEKARPYIVTEIRDPTSVVDYEVLAALADATLPEVDEALLEQVKTFAPLRNNGDFVMLRHKAMLLARYASPAIYDRLLEVYRASGERWQPDARGAVLGYFARYNEVQALPLVEQALAQTANGQDSQLLLELTRASYPAGVRELLRRRLEGEDPAAVGVAAYVMSQHGPEEDEKLLEARLERWRKEWGARVSGSSAPEATAQRMVEVNLVASLVHAKAWKLSRERAAQLTRDCFTEDCRRYAPK